MKTLKNNFVVSRNSKMIKIISQFKLFTHIIIQADMQKDVEAVEIYSCPILVTGGADLKTMLVSGLFLFLLRRCLSIT